MEKVISTPKDKWNHIYSSRHEPGQPAVVLTDNIGCLPDHGSALDIACGTGANTLLLAEYGLHVDAWDISDVVIQQLKVRAPAQHVTPAVVDIQAASLQGKAFDVIVNCHYLDRSLIEPMIAAVAPAGLIFLQTFVKERALKTGPTNPEFLLLPGELDSMMQGLEIIAQRDGSAITDPADPLAGRAYVVARKN